MQRNHRIGLIAAAVIVLAIAFIALRPDDSSTPTTSSAATTTATGTVATSTGTTAAPTPKPDPGPLLTSAGITTIKVSKGDQVRFRVRSSGAEEIHVHGYDLKQDVAAGATATMHFTADVTGIFEIEFEHSGTQIGKLVVEP